MAINFNKAEFVLSAVRAETFIRDGKPQVTFAGRSNVGKSSVINRLLGRKNFARVGATPGKTSQINYFDIDGRLYFTDLPGYGYAKVSKEERDRWGRLMERYFAEEGLITLGVLIVDARHKPTADDVTMCDWFKGTGCPVIVVANKLDKLKKSEIEPNLALIRQTLTLPEEALLIPFPPRRAPAKRSSWQPSARYAPNKAKPPAQPEVLHFARGRRGDRFRYFRGCTNSASMAPPSTIAAPSQRAASAFRPAAARRKHGAPCTAANAVEYHHAVQAGQQQGREVFHIWVSCVP